MSSTTAEAALQQGLSDEVVCIPVKLSAFVLNYRVTHRSKDEEPKNWCIGPLLQPEYSGLRIDPQYIRNDVNPRAEGLWSYRDGKTNPRICNLATEVGHPNRLGIYLHWTLPQIYRSAAESLGSSTTFKETMKAEGYRQLYPHSNSLGHPDQRETLPLGHSSEAVAKETVSRVERLIPNRWLVWRWIDLESIEDSVKKVDVPEFEVFLIESDRCRSMSSLGKDVDIEVDVTPFVDMSKPPSEQGDFFLGMKHETSSDPVESEAAPSYVPLSIFTTSNPLFADFQPHNGNVLSMVDTLSYMQKRKNKKPKQIFLSTASVSYCVIGWVSNRENDIMFHSGLSHEKLLENLGMMLASGNNGQAVNDWLRSEDAGQSVCHGALYNVKWKVNDQPAIRPVEDFARILADNAPVSVGSTPLESLRASLKRITQNLDGIEDVRETSNLLYHLEHFKLGEHEPVSEEYRKKDDMLEAGFLPSIQSSTWNFTKENPTPQNDQQARKRPALSYTTLQIRSMIRLGRRQALRDACHNECLSLQWKLFAEWWKFMSDERRCSPEGEATLNKSLQGRVRDELANGKILQCRAFLKMEDQELNKLSLALGESTKGPGRSFYRRKDPTVTVSGTPSPWEHDFTDILRVRLLSQVKSVPDGVLNIDTNNHLNEANSLSFNLPLGPISGKMALVIGKLTKEWCFLRFQKSTKHSDSQNEIMPLFHDKTPAEDGTGGRDFWNETQPFFPLFVEWEAVYFHIDYKAWAACSNGDTLTYDLQECVANTYRKNVSALCGRDLILPQVASEMIQKAELGSQHDTVQNQNDRDRDRELLKIPHLSFSLRGLTEQLTTRFAYGSHLTPMFRLPGKQPTVVKEAIALPTFPESVICLMDSELDPLPYGNLVDTLVREHSPSLVEQQETPPSPFRPATHGQLCITKINVIDRFGQVVSTSNLESTDPLRFDRFIYPAVADRYCCKPLQTPHGRDTSIANTVILDKEGKCAFIQLQPSINQNARLNAHFVVPTKTDDLDRKYRPIYEQWENPIWGWIIVNYADFGIQFFLPSGKFYGEVRLGGRQGATMPVRWVPFEKPPTVRALASPNEDVTELEALMETLKQPKYAASFIKMIGQSLPSSQRPPGGYSEQMSSMVGRPLALVNFGVSLELAEPPRENESTINPAPPEKLLTEYEFPFKLGEPDRLIDGLVGYFQSPSAPVEESGSTSRNPDMTTCFTYFPGSSPAATASGPRLEPIADANLPVIKPYYVSFLNIRGQMAPNLATESHINDRLSEILEMEHAKHLRIFAGIIDPYLAVHIDTGGLLPVQSFQLPPWTVKDALEKLTFFFQAGPIIVADDPLNPRKKPVTTGDDVINDTPLSQKAKVELPVLGIGTWEWLQPVVESSTVDISSAETVGSIERRRRYESFEVAPVDMGISTLAAPQTAVEGYLHLIEPLASTVNKNENS